MADAARTAFAQRAQQLATAQETLSDATARLKAKAADATRAGHADRARRFIRQAAHQQLQQQKLSNQLIETRAVLQKRDEDVLSAWQRDEAFQLADTSSLLADWDGAGDRIADCDASALTVEEQTAFDVIEAQVAAMAAALPAPRQQPSAQAAAGDAEAAELKELEDMMSGPSSSSLGHCFDM